MSNNLKTYKLILSLCFSVGAYSFLPFYAKAQIKLLVDSDAVKTFSGQQSKDGIEYVDICLMSSFDDSVIISIGQRNTFNRFCRTDHSLGQAANTTTPMPEDGDLLTIYCFNEKLKQTIRFKRGYAYLYVWKVSGKFRFEFTNKILWLE